VLTGVEGSTAFAGRPPLSFGKSDSKTSALIGRTNGVQRKESSIGSANPDWPYKCFQAMSEPIVDRVVRLMKDEEL
jgi:hypothetical protein